MNARIAKLWPDKFYILYKYMLTHAQLSDFLDQIRNPNKRNWIIMVPNSLGETVAVCGLANGFLKKYGSGITLVIPESHAFIAECFPGTFDRVVFMNLELMRQFSATGFIPPNFFNIDFPINTWAAQYGDGRLGTLHELWVESLGSAGLSFINMYRYILRLDWASEFTAPKVPEDSARKANELIAKLNVKHKKTVIFFVGNNSNKPAPAYFWAKLAQLYKEKGYDVLINGYGAMLFPDGLSIPGVPVVDIPLDLSIPFCEYAGNVVIGANGFVALALASKMDCKLNVLLTNEVCCDYANFLYKEFNPLTGCYQLVMPELTAGMDNLREWIILGKHDISVLNEIADCIVFERESEFLISSTSSSVGNVQ